MGQSTTIQKLLEKFSKLDKITILDIGACDFSEGINLKRLFPNSNVYAIEADNINFQNHSRNAVRFGVKPFNLAIADFDGKTTLDRKSTRLNSSHTDISRMPSSA